MPITFNCPCGKSLRVADENAGRRVKCPACQAVATVPAPEPDFEVVEDEPKEKLAPKPAAKPAAKQADEDDEDEDRRGYGVAKSKKGGDDDEDDEPKAKKKPKPRKRPRDDDDDDDEDDRPRSRRSSDPDAGKKVMYLAGGALMVVGGIALAVIGWQGQGRSANRGLILGICLVVVGLGTMVRGITGNFDD